MIRIKGQDDDDPLYRRVPRNLPLTYDADFITFDDSKENQVCRLKMPCGHVLSPHSVAKFAREELEKGKWRFFCPFVANRQVCNREWDYGSVIKVYGGLTDDEKLEFDVKMSENCLERGRRIVSCPQCQTPGERINPKDIRMECAVCTSFDFCWLCQRKWQTSNTKQCGNPDCSGEDPRFKILRECNRKTISNVPNCFSKRACPGCGMIIEHTEACKHMDCKCCTQFCFICLKVAPGRGQWQCGSYNSPCPLAPLQTSIVGAEED